MEKFFLKYRTLRFETWLWMLLALLMLTGVITFGALVNHASVEYSRAGLASKAALKVARIPADTGIVVSEIFNRKHPAQALEQKYSTLSGFQLFQQPKTLGDLLLLSRFDGDLGRSIVEIVDPKTGDVLHQYLPDISDLRRRISKIEKQSAMKDPTINVNRDHRPGEYGMYHPFVEDDGSLIFKNYHTPLVKIDACSQVQWIQYGAYHHSLERGHDGHYWTVKRIYPQKFEQTTREFEEDGIVQVSSDGEILFEKAISEILGDNGLDYLLHMGPLYDDDPFHLNDIQPVLVDGPHWKQGDLFLSLRNRSAIILYRPVTNKVLWVKQGPWFMQHDVDILSDHEIIAFSNNTAVGKNGMYVVGSNDLISFDFSIGEANFSYTNVFRELEISTIQQGLFRVLKNSDIFVEETDAGRLLMLDSNGDVKWSYVNSSSNGVVYTLHWSRYIEASDANDLRQAIEAGFACNQ